MQGILQVLAFLLLLAGGLRSYAQQQPRLVVALVVDQMRWDFLHRYQDRYTKGGFRRLLAEGYAFNQTYINYLPSLTAVGHASIFTGSVPAIHGIVGNEWPDPYEPRLHYCTEDSAVTQVGGGAGRRSMSPRNLKTTTIGDELRLATNFESKVVAVSLKDRAAILPGGHKPTAAFWYDDQTGHMLTSTWYARELPSWVNAFNKAKVGEKLLATPWQPLYREKTYRKSTEDAVAWERVFKGGPSPAFPHEVNKVYRQDKGVLRNTPMGNTFILSFAQKAIEGYQLGQGSHTDLLTINCASTDYIGHQFGPNSVEVEDTYLRLDKDLEGFLDFLDRRVGRENYLLVLTADHGCSHAIGYLQSLSYPAGWMNGKEKQKLLNAHLESRYGVKELVKDIYNYQVYFDLASVAAHQLDFVQVKAAAVAFLKASAGVQFVADMERIHEAPIPGMLKEMMINGYNYRRSGQLTIIPEPGWFDGPRQGTTHGTWNPTDTHIPLVFLGWKVLGGFSNEPAAITDIAPTLAALLNIQVPNGSIGKVLNLQLK